eukprot:CAMPEP_0194025916 /NCGR_PEP_ID=MMETSP0009_2-20130614/209_1 /TAXON_ID=210454 /ORGANISM="Grammatophora oceanica, Strain CCMP 410" /LENGTH=593 /DNA_ID=CAMNT_0038664313 /DNA_START=43 /DNA_END=1824 /DNA_ORIENTATION=-
MNTNLRATFRVIILARLFLDVLAGSYTPSSVNNGQLPNGDDDITFTTYNGNWVSEIKLPTSPANGATVHIQHNAGYASIVKDPRLDLDLEEIRLGRGEELTVTFDSNQDEWRFLMEQQSPQTGSSIDNSGGQSFIEYVVWNGNWIGTIGLPATKNSVTAIVVRSDADWQSKIEDTHLVAKSTTTLRRGDRYVLTWNDKYKKWIINGSPNRAIGGNEMPSNGLISNPTSPQTTVSLWNGAWVGNIYLPNTGRQGDTVTINSQASWASTIHTDRTDMPASQRLKSGQFYTFVYRTDRRVWVLYDYTETTLRANQLPSNGRPVLPTPTTHISLWNGNWMKDIVLPQSPVGYRVHFRTDAGWSFDVSGHGMGKVAIHNGERVTFVVNGSGNWERETITVDILLLYGQSAVDQIGETAARQRMVDGIDMTNEGLLNSLATFRYRTVGLERFQQPAEWESIFDAVNEIRSHPVAQARRSALKADSVYYEGAESGCGVAYYAGNSFNAAACGSLNCGVNAMRHELGHNMGLGDGVRHPDDETRSNVGNSLENTIMGGNAIPYFCTGEKLSPVTKLPLDYGGKLECVEPMNESARIVATHF